MTFIFRQSIMVTMLAFHIQKEDRHVLLPV